MRVPPRLPVAQLHIDAAGNQASCPLKVRRKRTVVAAVGAFLALGFTAAGPVAADDLPAEEVAYRSSFEIAPIKLVGRVVSETGRPLSGVEVELEVSGTLTDSTTTNFRGSFLFSGLERANRLLRVKADGYRETLLAVHLFQPIEVAEVEIEPILLPREDPDIVRFLFGGDVSFGRRFLDPQGTTPRDQIPPDNPDALILVSDPLPGTRMAVDFIRPAFQAADFGVCNFESPVLVDTSTAHPYKSFAFFTLPGSLPALAYLGIDYVGLGNNHLFDYLEPGIATTLSYLNSQGIPATGAGHNSTEAYLSYRTEIAGSPYSFIAATSVAGQDLPEGYDFVAGPDKGGGADLRDSAAMSTAIAREIDAGYLPILQVHTGKEYAFEITAYAAGRFESALNAGAALIIGHHPHIAQGFEFANGVLMAHSLGNFIFDQDRLETMLGVLAEIDMDGAVVRRVRALPIYLEDYRPRPIVGPLADLLLRRLGEFSRGGAVVFPTNHQGWVSSDLNRVSTTRSTVAVTIVVPAEGTAVIDLREYAPSSSWIVSARSERADSTASLGRDIMEHGNFEDQDVDDQEMEVSRWDVSGDSSFPCLHNPFRGAVALCSVRHAGNVSDSVIPFRNRIRVMGDAVNLPNKDLTLFGYMRGSNAGPARIVARYHASAGEAQFGEEEVLFHHDGSFGWQKFFEDLTMPPDPPEIADPETEAARAIRIFLRHSPPDTGEGLLSFDEMAIINWESAQDLQAGLQAENTPNAFQFLRIKAPPGQFQLTLTFESRHPQAADWIIPRDKIEHPENPTQ